MKPILLDLPMPITTPRLLIRPPAPGDGLVFNEAVLTSFDTIRYTLAWTKKKPTINTSEEFVRRAAASWILKKNEEPYLPLFIFEKESLAFIGTTGFHHVIWEVPCLEVGYWINNLYAGHGYMTEAVSAITLYAFKQIRTRRIAITCDINNLRSQKIPERLGFSLEATLKANRIDPITNNISDTLVYARYDLHNFPMMNASW